MSVVEPVPGRGRAVDYVALPNDEIAANPFKRGFDIAFAVLALLNAGVFMVIIALVIRLTTKGPVFFAHDRVGLNGKSFKCLKFRTMYVDGDARLAEHLANDAEARAEYETYRKLKNDPRVIRGVGKLLRRTSMDELPQFINVLRGDMSIVGPRPVTAPEMELYGSTAPAVLSVRPGITGLWQVSGRNSLTFEERVVIDRDYVSNWSFRRDMKIVLRTVQVLLFERDAY